MSGIDSLPASLLRQWAYCPRIPFFREALGIAPAMPKWTAQGVDFDALQSTLSRDRRFRTLAMDRLRPLRHVSLNDSARRIHGVVDLIMLAPDRLYVCDYKLEAARVERGARLQLGSYAIMAEQQYGVPCAGLIVLTGKPMRLLLAPWTETCRKEVEEAIRNVHAALAAGMLPASDAGPAKCGICEYLNYCNDRA